MKVIYNSIIPFGSFKAMTLGPWIFCKHGTTLTPVDINHEAIHWEQYKELLIIAFHIVYVFMFAWELIRCTFNSDRGKLKKSRNNSVFKRAYRSMALEREAYSHEEDMDYIASRPLWNWLKE